MPDFAVTASNAHAATAGGFASADRVGRSFLAGGREDGSVRADVNATDVIMCGAMGHPQPLPAPQVTPQDIEDAFAAAEPGPC